MQLKTTAEYAGPDDYIVKITLTGTLAGFEKMRKALGQVPLYEVDNLIYQIDEVSRKLRGRVEAEEQLPPLKEVPAGLDMTATRPGRVVDSEHL